MENLINKIKNNFPLNSEAEEFLYSISNEKTLSKGGILIREGQAVKKTYFVIDGCVSFP